MDEKVDEALRRAEADRKRLEPLLVPIRAWAKRRRVGLKGGDLLATYRAPSDAERHAARRLNVEVAQVKLASRALWRKDFDQERDSRIGDVAELEARSRQARRGLVAREMLTELEQLLKEATAEAETEL